MASGLGDELHADESSQSSGMAIHWQLKKHSGWLQSDITAHPDPERCLDLHGGAISPARTCYGKRDVDRIKPVLACRLYPSPSEAPRPDSSEDRLLPWPLYGDCQSHSG